MKKLSLFAIVAAAAVLLLSACSPQAAPAEATPAVVEPQGIIAEGRLVPANSLEQAFSLSGQVAEVLVQDGETVQIGQPLARLADSPEAKLALRRAEAYARAGADILFVESPESEEEMRQIGRSVDKPLLANMVEGGRTPVLTHEELQAIGYKLAIFPVTALLAATQAMKQVYTQLQRQGSSAAGSTALMPFAELTQLMGFEDVWAFERQYAETL